MLVPIAASLMACALLAAPTEGQAQDEGFGSSVPCAVPLSWRLESVDGRFALSESEAEAAVVRAASLWESATSRRLFERGREGSMRIAFRFDDRQVLVQLRREMEAELAEARAEIDQRREALEALSRDLQTAQEAYMARVDAHEARRAAHDAQVRRWSEEPTLPDDVREALNRSVTELNASRRSLQSQEGELDAAYQRLRAQTDELNRDIEELNRRSREWGRSTPARAEEAGRYSETVRTLNGEVVDVERRIDIHRFASQEELVWVIAHELGHALGLGHASVAGAVMSAVSTSGVGAVPETALHPADVEMLRSRCPGL